MTSDSRSLNTPQHTSSFFVQTGNDHSGYNELFDQQGRVRPQWRPIVETMDRGGIRRLQEQQRRAERMRHEDGATFNPFADPDKRSSCWPLNIIPMPLSAADWQSVEKGVIQRAQVLEAILEDVYGQQRLVREGHIPAELVYANPSFLHPCHSIIPAGGRFLSFYAVDLYRDTDGNFKVVRDFASDPAGLGYCLGNRIVLSRVFPELYHANELQLLAPFFQRLHRSIIERNALGRKDPGIVLLSPGPECLTYFEHAFLSRYLGYPLVEGQDLTIRDGKVFLKKLAGLEPVEAIFRQIADGESDPFSLRQASSSGVAGLIQAAREGMIDLVNPVGSGFVDTPLLAGYMPELCRLLRNEELLLAGRDVVWGGTPEGLEELLSNPGAVQHSLRPDMVSAVGEELIEEMRRQPFAFMRSNPVLPSLVPVWQESRIATQHVLLRVFGCATAQGFAVLPGGLAMTAPDIETLLAGDPLRLQSMDVWALSESPVEPFSMLASLEVTAELSRSSDLPSRVADNLLWLGRYLERTEGRIRLLRAILRRISSEARLRDIPELLFLLRLLQSSDVQSRMPAYRELKVLLHGQLFARDNPDSIVALLARVHRTARNVRDRLSLDCWRVISHLEATVTDPADDPLELLDDTLFNLSAFSGLAMESMTRGLGWRFMDMGRRIERAMFHNSVLQRGLPGVCADQRSTLEALLEVGDSAMTYRARYRTTYQLAPALDLLIVDESNPKSLAFQFSQLAAHVEFLPRQQQRRYSTPEERIALDMLTATRLVDLQEIHCGSVNHDHLIEYLKKTEELLLDFAQKLAAHYLSRVPSTPHFSGQAPAEEH